MGIIELLSSDNYIIVNKTIAHKIGLNEAILLGELASEYKFWKAKNELIDNEFFFSTVENIEENTTLTDKQQRTAIKNLVEAKILKVTIKGLPPRRYFKFNESTILQIFNNEYCQNGINNSAKMEEFNLPEEQTNNNKYNNNKEEEKEIYNKEREQKFDTNEQICESEQNLPSYYNTNDKVSSPTKVSAEDIDLYFGKIYELYPRHISRVQAKETFEHKLRDLTKDEARNKALVVYKMVEKQKQVWENENDGQGRKSEMIPYLSTWLNDNIENSPHFKRGRK